MYNKYNHNCEFAIEHVSQFSLSELEKWSVMLITFVVLQLIMIKCKNSFNFVKVAKLHP